MSKRPTVLMILDGYGLNNNQKGNAVAEAKTPVVDKLMAEYPFVKGYASGLDVGLPEGDGKLGSRTSEYGVRTYCVPGIDKNHKIYSGWRFL